MTSNTKQPTVTIYFCDDNITALFCALLSARGVPTKTPSDRSELARAKALITEARFFELLDLSNNSASLIVGNKVSLQAVPPNKGAVVLSQPLTEIKVERAIDDFVTRLQQAA